MDKIQQLALLLKQVQTEKRASYLPEHYCVDLVKMACERQFLEILHSLDGKEFITPARLKREITEKNADCGGRIALTELGQILGVDFGIIKKYAMEICLQNERFIILNEEMISSTYIDRIVSEMQDILEANGHLTYADIHKKFSITTDFMQKITKERTGQTFHGYPSQLFNGSFITDFEENRMRAKISGFLLAVKYPISITTIAKSLEFQDSYIIKNIKNLIEEYPSLGVLRLNVFFPLKSSENLNEYIINEMDRKGYIAYKSLKSIPLDASTLLKDVFKNCNKKDTFFYSKILVTKQFLDSITSKLIQCVDSLEILNTNTLFEDSFEESDCLQIIDFCLRQSKLNSDSLIYIQNKNIIFSTKLISLIYEKIIEFAKEQTFQKLCCDQNFQKLLLKVKNEIHANESDSKKRGQQKGGKDFLHQNYPISMFNNIMDPGLEFPASEEILARAYQNFIQMGVPIIMEVMHKFSTESGQNLSMPMGENNKERTQNLVKNAISRFNLMILYVKSASVFEKDLNEKIVQNIVKIIGTGISENLLRIYIYRISKKLQISETDLESLKNDENLSLNNRNSLLQLITDQNHNKCFSLLFQSLKNYNDFINAIMAVKDRSICDIQFNLNLKKKEIKSVIDIHITYQTKLMEKFLDTKNPTISEASAAFQSCVSLMLSKYCDLHLIFPPKYISDIIYKFSHLIEPSTKDIIHQIKGSFVQLLTNKKSDEKEIPESLIANLTALCNQEKQFQQSE